MVKHEKILKTLILVLSPILMLNPLFAQDDAGDLSLNDCISIAIEKNYNLKSAEYDYQTAEKDVTGSYSGILPTLSARAGSGRLIQGAAEFLSTEPVGVDPETGNIIYGQITRVSPKQERKSTSASVTVGQNIFDGGIWWNRINKAKTDRQSSEYSFLNERNRTILSIQTAFFDLNKQSKLLGANVAAVERSQAQLERSEKMFELGATARLDVYRAQVNLGNDRIVMLNQKNIVESARKNLNIVMGRDPMTPLNIKSSPLVNEKLPEIDELINTAKKSQPILKKYKEDIESNEYSISLAKGVHYPRISAYLQYDRFHEEAIKVFSDFDKNYQTRYGINFSIDLFKGFSDYANVQKAQIGKRYIEEAYEEYKRNLQANIQQNYDDYHSMLVIITINQQNLEAAKEELRLSEERYQIGAGTSLEVRESQVNMARAEQTLIAAQYNALSLLAQLQYELGISYEDYQKNLVDMSDMEK